MLHVRQRLSAKMASVVIQDPSALPWRFRCPAVVSTPQPRNRFGARNTSGHGNLASAARSARTAPPHAISKCSDSARPYASVTATIASSVDFGLRKAGHAPAGGPNRTARDRGLGDTRRTQAMGHRAMVRRSPRPRILRPWHAASYSRWTASELPASARTLVRSRVRPSCPDHGVNHAQRVGVASRRSRFAPARRGAESDRGAS